MNNSKNKSLEESTVGMAVMDAFPVIFFLGSVISLYLIRPSVIFIIGGVICTTAGMGKVIWKFILAVSKKNVFLLYKQFKYLMSIGFLLMIISLFIGKPEVSFSTVIKYITWFPGNICFIIGLLGFILMIISSKKLDLSTKRGNFTEQAINLITQIFIFFGVLLCSYGSDIYYSDSVSALAAESTESVKVTEEKYGLFFDSKNNETLFIFYPGAKVEYTAYAPLMQKLAYNGIDCYIVEMPYNLAVFGVNKAKNIINETNYENIYIGGHSLGGAMAANFAASNPDELNGVILLAAYPTKKLSDSLSVLTLYGSEDYVLNKDKLTETEIYLPKNSFTYCIEGGNHAQFGSYGEQKGDGNAKISSEEQLNITKSKIIDFIDKEG